MKRLLFSVLTLLLFSCTFQNEQISGRIEGWGNDTLFVDYYSFSDVEGKDTIYAKNGQFSFTLPMDSLTEFQIYRKIDMYPRQGGDYRPSTRIIDLLVTPEERLKIKGRSRSDKVLEYNVKGSLLMEDISKVRAQTLNYSLQKDSNEFRIEDAYERGASSEETDKLFARRREINKMIREVEREHIRAYPERVSSAFYTLEQPLDSFPAYYDRLSDDVKVGMLKPILDSRMEYWKEYQAYLENKEKEFIGNPAPDFTLTDIDGNRFTLSDFDADKYIVLDFWGSWCGPCLMGMPEMKKYYERYGQKLEIIGIACRDKDEDWRKSVAENSLEWIHLFNDDSSVDNNVAVMYAVGAYPTKIIIAPDKTVAGIFKGEGEDFYKELDKLLQ
jgi:thiol-disulfide isomerase/thioredoxin